MFAKQAVSKWLIAQGFRSHGCETIGQACTLARMIDRREDRSHRLESQSEALINQWEQMSMDGPGPGGELERRDAEDNRIISSELMGSFVFVCSR